MCTRRQTGSAQIAPAAQRLGSSPEASGRSLQISASGSRTAWAATPHLQVLQEARGALGRPTGRSQCALVSPAGHCRGLQVSALGSEQPGPQHPVSRQCRRSAVHQRPPGKRQLALVSPALTRPTNTSENQMAKGKYRNVTNRNQGNMAASERNSPTTASPGYPNKPEKQDLDLKSLVMMLLEEHKKDINRSLKEIQGNMNKLEALTMKTQKSLKFKRIGVNR